MTDSNTVVLKHRLVGAAILLFFAAVFLPWLLGSSPEEDQTPVAVVENEVDPKRVLFRDQDTADSEVRTFTSVIKPVDGSSPGLVEQESVTQAAKESKAKKAVKSTPLKADNLEAAIASELDALKNTESKKQSSSPIKSVPAQSPIAPAEKPKEIVTLVTPKTKPKPPVKTKEISTANSTPATVKSNPVASKPQPAKPAQSKPVTVGWIVQVGVFRREAGAQSVVADLKKNGLNPSTKPTKTNSGPATTVFLGPFAERVEAAREKKSLKTRTGSDGFIKAYP